MDPTCSTSHKTDETALHILCDCECLTRTIGNYFIEPDKPAWITIERLAFFIRRGLRIERWGCTIDLRPSLLIKSNLKSNVNFTYLKEPKHL